MELKIKPHHKNSFPLSGILIKGTSVVVWLQEIQRLKLDLKNLQVYPIPDIVPNTIWGCFLITSNKINIHELGKNEMCQMVTRNLFIPERAMLYPATTAAEVEQMFTSARHIIHPEFGLVELTEEVSFQELVIKPVLKSYFVIQPEGPVFIPKQIKSYYIQPVTPEEILKNLEENIFPKKEEMKHKPLNLLEKGKLFFYKLLFPAKKDKAVTDKQETERTKAGSILESFLNSMSVNKNGWFDKLKEDFDNLEERNKKQVDKLLELLKNNPEEALKYAIPLDDNGSNRGGQAAKFDLSKRWADFSLFGYNSGSGSGNGTINLGDHFYELKTQYNRTAEELIKQGEYHKAAFIYMKLLKNDLMAAQTLESGNYFGEAATIYLKNNGNKKKAAECYEKGKMTQEAIELYKDLNENEKVGDLYITIHKQKEANIYFEKVIDNYKLKNQYIKASLIYKNKMNDHESGQALLLSGWKSNMGATNCLTAYFSNIGDIKLLKNEINSIYSNDITLKNAEPFLQVIRHEYKKKNELSNLIKEMAYEIIASQIPSNPSIVSEMKEFNKNDSELVKDALRFRIGKKQ